MLHHLQRTAMAGAVLVLFAGAAEAKPACRDASGKFTACPAPAAAQAARCRSATGQFMKCPAPTAARTGAAVNTAAVVPATGAATARCRDGSMSASRHRSGTCAGHGGVAAWLQPR
jgi:hypothetical protein